MNSILLFRLQIYKILLSYANILIAITVIIVNGVLKICIINIIVVILLNKTNNHGTNPRRIICLRQRHR
jgi:hypothetical protein